MPKTGYRVVAASIALAFSQLSISENENRQSTPNLTALEEVVVTASKREQALLEIPTSVQAFGGEDLEVRQFGDLKVLLNEIPGATTNQSLSAAFTITQMRASGGLGQTGDSAVSYYLDEVPFFFPNVQLAPIANMYDLNRLEVLRGPQGTIWGQGSMGGTFRYVTNNPDSEGINANVRLVGSQMKDGDTSGSLDAMINVPISDTFAIRIAGGVENVSGFADIVDPVSGAIVQEDVNGVDSSNIRAKALWRPNESFEVSMMYWHIENEQDGGGALTGLEPPTLDPAGGFFEGETDVANLTFTWSTDGFDLVSSTSLLEHTVVNIIGVENPLFGRLDFGQEFTTENFVQELRLVSNDASAFKWLVGASITKAELDVALGQEFGNPLFQSALGSTSGQVIDTKSYALFGEFSYELMGGKLVPLFGIRYYEDDRSLVDNTIAAPGIDENIIGAIIGLPICDPAILSTLIPGLPLRCETALPEFEDGDTFSSVNPRFSLTYFPEDNWSVYANAAKGFRSGTVQTLGQAAIGSVFGLETSTIIEDDSVWSYEIGTKYDSPDGKLSAEMVAYLADYDNAQGIFAVAGAPVALSVGDYRAEGLEFGLSIRPNSNWTLTATGGLVEATWQDVNSGVTGFAPVISKGEDVAFVPKWNFMISVSHTGALGFGNLQHFERISFSSRDEQFEAVSGVSGGQIDDLQLQIGVMSERWEAHLFGRNLTDERGPYWISSNGLFYGARPMEVGFNVRFNM